MMLNAKRRVDVFKVMAVLNLTLCPITQDLLDAHIATSEYLEPLRRQLVIAFPSLYALRLTLRVINHFPSSVLDKIAALDRDEAVNDVKIHRD